MPIEVPRTFRMVTVEREGRAGQEWLDGLPRLVDELLDRWGCAQDGDVMHGAVGIVVPVLQQGRPAALKVSFPHPANRGEWGALAAFDGQGAVHLYDVDEDRFAMVLERVQPHDLSAVQDVDEALRLAGAVARRLAVPAPPDVTRLSDVAGRCANELAHEHGRTDVGGRLPEPVVTAAIATFDDLVDHVSDTMIHGDLHFTNVLQAQRDPWLAIDPKGIAGTAGFDAATVVRHRLLELVSRPLLADTLAHRVGVFSEAADVDFDLAMRCTHARFVSSYYWELRHDSRAVVTNAMRAASIAAARYVN